MKTVCLRLSDLNKCSFDCMSIIERELFFYFDFNHYILEYREVYQIGKVIYFRRKIGQWK